MSSSQEQSGNPRKRRFSDVEGAYESVIGAKVTVNGEIRGVCDVDLHGILEGNVELEGFLRVREGGRIVGDVTATNVIVEGEVRGSIRAQEKAELRSACRVEGDLIAESVAIADGGHFEGKITMAGRPEPREQVSFEEKRKKPD